MAERAAEPDLVAPPVLRPPAAIGSGARLRHESRSLCEQLARHGRTIRAPPRAGPAARRSGLARRRQGAWWARRRHSAAGAMAECRSAGCVDATRNPSSCPPSRSCTRLPGLGAIRHAAIGVCLRPRRHRSWLRRLAMALRTARDSPYPALRLEPRADRGHEHARDAPNSNGAAHSPARRTPRSRKECPTVPAPCTAASLRMPRTR